MGFSDYIKSALEIIKLNGSEAEKISKDTAAFGMGIVFIAIAGVAMAIGSFNLPGIIFMPIFMVVAYFIGVGITHILAIIFGGQASYMELFRTMSVASAVNWISVIPVLGPMLSPLVGIWSIVMSVTILKSVHKLSTARAVIVVLIPIILVAVIAIALAAVIMTTLAGLFGGAAAGAGLAQYLG